jgi:hypothetical protein
MLSVFLATRSQEIAMKKLLATTLLLAVTSAAIAEPALMLGVSHNFGGATGITLKLLSSNREEKAALAVGVSYAPGREASRWSWDTGVAYNFKSSALVLSYDWVPGETQLSFGVANLKASAPAPAPASSPSVTSAPSEPSAPTDTCVDAAAASKAQGQAVVLCPR